MIMPGISKWLGDPVAKTGVWRLLDNPILWESRRITLDIIFRLYPNRANVLRQWGMLDEGRSVLDIGCGTGQYQNITDGEYLGVDLNERYIEHAQRRVRNPNHTFRCADALSLLEESRTFDLVLMVDFLHHLSDEECTRLLSCAARLGRRVAIFDQISEQSNPISRWIVAHDRGAYVRPLNRLTDLISGAGLTIEDSRRVMIGPIVGQAILARPTST